MRVRRNKVKRIAKNKLKKKTKILNVKKRSSQKITPDPWKEIRLKLQPLSKAYGDFMEKRKSIKIKKERIRLKE